MTCTRCEGLMLKENMIDMEAGYGEMWSHSWRCFNCGHRDDSVIRHHRQTRARQMVVSSEAVMIQEAIELSQDLASAEPLAA
jgi:C4-type Zn-finger protein